MKVRFEHSQLTSHKDKVSSNSRSPKPAKIRVRAPKTAGSAALPDATTSMSPVRVSCVINTSIPRKKTVIYKHKGVVSNGGEMSTSPNEWTPLEHSSYDIFMQEMDPFQAQVDQVRERERKK